MVTQALFHRQADNADKSTFNIFTSTTTHHQLGNKLFGCKTVYISRLSTDLRIKGFLILVLVHSFTSLVSDI